MFRFKIIVEIPCWNVIDEINPGNESFLRFPRRSKSRFFPNDREEDQGILPGESHIAIRSALNSEANGHPFVSQPQFHDSSGTFARSRAFPEIK